MEYNIMLISTSDGITSKVLRTQSYHNGTTFQYVGSGGDIVFEIPTEDFDVTDLDGYTGGWTPMLYGGAAVVLNSADTNHTTIYGSIVLRVSKPVADGSGVAWSW